MSAAGKPGAGCDSAFPQKKESEIATSQACGRAESAARFGESVGRGGDIANGKTGYGTPNTYQ
jgi:hypothetical protein